MAGVKGVYLAGSVPLPDAETVFRDVSTMMPNRLRRIPDGETGFRLFFVFTQLQCFQVHPPMIAEFRMNLPVADVSFTKEQVDEGIAVLEKSDMQTGYDKWAIESYATFKKLKEEGVIPKKTRMQICIPSAANVVGPMVQKAFQARAAPIWERALHKAVVNILNTIPHEDLSIQFDMAVDTALWEGVYVEKYFEEDPKTFTVDYMVRMFDWLPDDVELGLHNCYGDMEHRHWWEPPSLKSVGERGIALLEKSKHKIQYFHCPVPVSAQDNLDDFIKPLVPFYEKLRAQGGELYLGVLQHKDLEGTKKRIETALKYLPEFGVATECGMGRTPPEQVHDFFKMSAELAAPIY